MNFTSISMQLAKLHNRFSAMSFDAGLERAKSQIREDETHFSQWVSHDFLRGNWPRRSILIAPCITRRDVDYHALGLTAHLSAGVATIFCNSVVKGYSNGGSCLIGFGGWETKPRDAGAIEGPYHGAVPGVFAPQIKDAGPLGDDERALVIVDVDPEHPTQANPRPQYRGDPARLVAHLPVIAMATDADRYAGWRGCAVPTAISALANEVAALAEAGAGHSTYTVAGSPDPIIRNLLPRAGTICSDLANLIPKSPGLRMRAKAFRASAVDRPELWPPPSIMDWIAVDLRGSEFAVLFKTPAATLPIDDDALPWIWIRPPDAT